ncbi:UPF0754 membrane protein YheB [Kurthia zopfii]|uniref:Predicted membrane protein n=1 Tax=Kurthia zopfii TaxID=1650 RepID=A0A8B4QDA6_9BACL|nr:DUF445 family protein [Kurthia zopfii]PWI23836.1 DUF445 domain-containing protein [Kurthia zopfii]TDR43411.1 uncharacterized membrane protein YheB (UPF0754 family) [Kurthia zopfii]GEK31567.1 UPF0754 membrane protein YheB [Kurthia zopfii]STX10665.1 Predicted membrane protein [Kurthia zopfii]
MSTFLTILFMVVVGALIGGATNHIAIKMLFRPHNPVYLWGKRLPFTPGLIPRRRDELAKQLGKTVVNYLLTPETFRSKFFNATMKGKASKWLNDKTQEVVFSQDKTLQQWLDQAGLSHAPQVIEEKVDLLIQQQIGNFQNVLATQTVEQLLPESWKAKADIKIPEISRYILNKGDGYFESPEGVQTIKGLIDGFLTSKGTFGGMVQMFIGDGTSLIPMFQREIKKFLTSDQTFAMLNNMIDKEWRKIQVQTIPQLVGELDFESTTLRVQKYAKEQLAIRDRLDLPLVHYLPDGAKWLEENAFPKLIDTAFDQGEKKLEDVLKRMDLETVVKEQVDKFPVETLEDLVLGISKREFKMITVLGFVLGGIIGLLQGFVAILL